MPPEFYIDGKSRAELAAWMEERERNGQGNTVVKDSLRTGTDRAETLTVFGFRGGAIVIHSLTNNAVPEWETHKLICVDEGLIEELKTAGIVDTQEPSRI